jgi:hypothetical protein
LVTDEPVNCSVLRVFLLVNPPEISSGGGAEDSSGRWRSGKFFRAGPENIAGRSGRFFRRVRKFLPVGPEVFSGGVRQFFPVGPEVFSGGVRQYLPHRSGSFFRTGPEESSARTSTYNLYI